MHGRMFSSLPGLPSVVKPKCLQTLPDVPEGVYVRAWVCVYVVDVWAWVCVYAFMCAQIFPDETQSHRVTREQNHVQKVSATYSVL